MVLIHVHCALITSSLHFSYDGGLASQNDESREEKLRQRLQANIELKKKLKQQQKQVLADSKPIEPVVASSETTKDENQDEPESTTTELKSDHPITLDTSDFQILGGDKLNQRHKVKRTLPSWLEYPEVISNDLSVASESIADLSFLSDQMKKNLKAMNIDHLFPVQRSVIPYLLTAHRQPKTFRPRDICVSAPTGSGKTIAFALPIVEALRSRVVPKIRALVVLPVRELANQVYQVFRSLCQDTGLVCGLLTAKRTLAEEQQLLVRELDGKYYSRVDIVIATAGRLVEHMHETKGFSLGDLKYLVIDEADRVMDQIQNDWLYHLGKHVKDASNQLFMTNNHLSVHHLENTKCAHKLLFSATLSSDPEKLEQMKLFRPKLFTSVVVSDSKLATTANGVINGEGNAEEGDNEELVSAKGEFIGKFTIPSELKERVCPTISQYKPLTLYSLIQQNNWKRFLCFANKTDICQRLIYVLRNLSDNKLIIEDMSSQRSKQEREAVNRKFAKGVIHGLVCTDSLARGVDFNNVDVVICYDCPRHVKTYIHRVGRTARAGKEGLSVIMVTEEEKPRLAELMKAMGRSASLEEMDRSAEIEEQNAAKYATVLEDLQKHLVKETKMARIKKMREENSAPTTANKNSILGLLQKQMQSKTGIKDMSTMLDGHERKRKAEQVVKKEKGGKNKNKKFKKA